MAIKYLLDEHIDPKYRAQMVRREPQLTVWLIGDPGAPTKGTLDPNILLWCEANGFLLVTNDRRSMPRHLANHLASGRHVPGILVLDPEKNLGQMVDELLLIAAASGEDEYQDLIFYLPLT